MEREVLPMDIQTRRVVVTGMGVVHALGTDPEIFWKRLAAGESGIRAIVREDFARFPTRIASFVEDFPEEQYLDRKESRSWDRFARFGVWASLHAWKSSGADAAGISPERIGVWLGSGIGGVDTLLRGQLSLDKSDNWRISPYTIPMMIGNMGAALVSMAIKACGPCLTPVSACATGNNAIGEAFLAIREGRVDAAVAGGAEAPIVPVSFAAFNSMRAMSTRNENPSAACAPFAVGRDGFVMGEGAGVLVLEERDAAVKRGAPVLAEIVGYGATADAYHITAPDPEGSHGAAAMGLAARMAGWEPGSVDYINAHATGTPIGDIAETKAIKRFTGPGNRLPVVSATKSSTGHLFGAAGGIEAVISVQALRHACIPPTINLVEADPECDLDYAPLVARSADLRRVLSNGFGFGGHNAVLAFQKA
jgi:3-oxoacyl-[acyl-carrier-protein] synthase II